MDQISNIETARISANPNNPRTVIDDVSDLMASIKAHGLFNPISVRWLKKFDEAGLPTGYEVVSGSRRFTACKELGMDKIPCIVVQADDATAFEMATAENIVRQNMSAVDEANAVAKLFNEGKTRFEIGAMFGKSPRWAEGRRKIVSLGEKAMEMLAAGRINLGHAEVLTMCSTEREVEKFLDYATWNKPEELKTKILSWKKTLDKAPFDYKKICAKCEKRSDCQRDLFGEVTEVYCMDGDCYHEKVAKECERIAKNYEKKGYKQVDEDDFNEAKNCYSYCSYIDANSEDEQDKQTIEKLKKAGIKPVYWVDPDTAENGLSYNTDELNKSEDDEDDEDDSLDKKDSLTWQDREAIREKAAAFEQEVARSEVEKFVDALTDAQQSFILATLTSVVNEYEEADEEGSTRSKEESPIQKIGESITYDGETKTQREWLIHEILDNICPTYSGVQLELRDFFGLKPHEEYIEKATTEYMAEKAAAGSEETKTIEEEAEEACGISDED